MTTIIRNKNAEGRSLFSAFLDIKKAFDWIDRDLLNYKLLSVGINGKIYNSIKRLYQNTTSCIKLNSINTEWFNVKSGVRQGDSLSPTLFNVYVNDLINELNSLNIGIDINGRKICCLLYADDIVIFSNTADKLQALLDTVHNWCFKWKMKLIYNKSNVMHFRTSRRSRTTVPFNYGTTALATVSTYKYLGVLLDEHLNFDKAVEELCHSAGCALGTIIGKFKTLRNVGYNTYTTLYNACVRPILEYSSAIWEDKRYTECNTIFNRAIRYFLRLPKNTPTRGLHGDMGWLNKVRLWNKLTSMHPDGLIKNIFESDWSSELCTMFNKIDMSNVFYNQGVCNIKDAQRNFEILCANEWKESYSSYPKLRTYCKLKTMFFAELYI